MNRFVKRVHSSLIEQLPSLWTIVVALLAGVASVIVQPAAAQSLCGQDSRVLPPIPASSPPVFHGFFFPGVNCGTTCTLLSFNVSSLQSWVTITSSTVLPPHASFSTVEMSTGYTIDVTGLTPGTYCAYYTSSWYAQGPAFASSGSPPALSCADGPQQLFGSICVNSQPPFTFADQITVTAPVSAVLLVDPVPDLVNGSAVQTSSQLQNLLTKGRAVNGVAADGVTQLVIRIDTSSPGHQFKLTLVDDQGLSGPSIFPNEDGGLDFPAGTGFSSGQLTITAGAADPNGTAHAFAVYRAPTDFARPSGSSFKSGTCNGSTLTDDHLACRSVSLQVQDITTNTALPSLPITILRPPIVLIHGLWSDWDGAWKSFSPLVTGKNSADSRFYVGRVNYKNPITPAITATNPTLSASRPMSAIQSNDLGFVYNAPGVAQQIGSLLGDFKKGHNPLNIPVAAIQADIVSHSMGGLVGRQLVLLPNFLDSSTNPTNNLNQGYIHKIITIDTPHLGSPLAAKLVDNANPHFREFLEYWGHYSLVSVTLANGTSPAGAMADMKGNGVAVDSSLSPALQTLAIQGPRLLPAALIAGNYTNWISLDCTALCTPARIRKQGPNDPLSQSLTSTGWPTNFGAAPNNLNDGLVGVTSQLNGAASSNLLFAGLAHSPALVGSYKGLGFTAPTVLDPATGTPPNPIAQKVVDLLNTPVTQPPFSQSVINP
jgi:hypothetical protein